MGTFNWNIKILRHPFFTIGLQTTMKPAFYTYLNYWLSWISIPPLGSRLPTSPIPIPTTFVQISFLCFSVLKWMKNALCFKKIYTLWGLSWVVILWQLRNGMKVTFAVLFGSKVSCILNHNFNIKMEQARTIYMVECSDFADRFFNKPICIYTRKAYI